MNGWVSSLVSAWTAAPHLWQGPVLIAVLGVVLILARRQWPQARWAGAWMAVALLAVVGVLAYGCVCVSVPPRASAERSLESSWPTSVPADMEPATTAPAAASADKDSWQQAMPAEALEQVDANVAVGSITVLGEDRLDVGLTARIVARAHSDAEAQRLADQVRMVVERAGPRLDVHPDVPETGPGEHVEVHLEIRLPWSRASAMRPAAGPVRRSVRCRTNVGPIRVEDIDAGVTATSNVGAISLSRIDGGVHARSSVGQIKIQRIDGGVDAESQTGAIGIDDVDGGVEAAAQTGAIEIRKVDGGVKAATQTGAIDISDIDGGVKAATQTGRIAVQDIDGTVDAETSVGAITVRDVKGDLRAHSRMGKVAASGISGNRDIRTGMDK